MGDINDPTPQPPPQRQMARNTGWVGLGMLLAEIARELIPILERWLDRVTG
jgi:hypothetical protein